MSSETTEATPQPPPTPPTKAEAPAEESKENKGATSNPEPKTETETKTAQKKAGNNKSAKAPSRRISLVASLKAENTRLRKELAKAKETISKLKRGQRVRSTLAFDKPKKTDQKEKGKTRPKKKVGAVSGRLYNPNHEQNKVTKRAHAKKVSELGACSFKPKRVAKHVSRKSKNRSKLAFSRLYLDADRLARKRAEKAQEEKAAKIKRFSFTPEVSEKSRKMQEKVSRRERMSRLSEPKPKLETNAPAMQKEDLIECTFKPRINPDNVFSAEGPLHQRLYQAGLEAKEKIARLREEKANREIQNAMSACTFQPNGEKSKKRTATDMRRIVDRLAVKDVERRLDNLNNSIKESSIDMSFVPQINEKTKEMTNQRHGTITERLYTVKIPKDNAPLDEECTFIPAVTQMAFEVDRSELPVHERLALHRSPSQREAFADMEEMEEVSDEGEEEEEYEEEDGEEELVDEGEEETEEEAEDDDEDEEEEEEEDITF